MPLTQKPELMMNPQSHVFYGVDVPTEGTNVALTAGCPATGREMGEMSTGPKFKRLGSREVIECVNYSSPIKSYIKGPGAQLTIVVNRNTAENIKLAIRGSSLDVMTDTSVLIGIGAETEIESDSILVSFETTDGSGDWGYIMLYDAEMIDETEVELDPGGVGMQMTFDAKRVEGRSTAYAFGEINLPKSHHEGAA